MPTDTFSTSDANDGSGYKLKASYPLDGSEAYNVNDALEVWSSRDLDAGPQYFVDNGFLRFDTSTISDTAAVSAAQLELYVDATVDTNGLNYLGEYYDFGGEPSVTGDHSLTETADAFTTAISGLTAGVVNNIALSNLSSISLTGFTGIRLKLSRRAADAAPTGFNRVVLASSEHATGAAPLLRVTYSDVGKVENPDFSQFPKPKMRGGG